MRLRTLRGKGLNDPLVGTAPIFKISSEGSAQLIGTGFWVTTHGHLITAWHVIQDNIGKDGVDEGPICAIQTLCDRTLVVRPLRKSDKHDTFDLALSETVAPFDEVPLTIPHVMTLDEPPIGSRVHTHSFLALDQDFSGERNPGMSTFTFRGEGIPKHQLRFDVSYMARVGFGTVIEHFPNGRDTVMLSFPCFQTDMPVYGANSGGPVFDDNGGSVESPTLAASCRPLQVRAPGFDPRIHGRRRDAKDQREVGSVNPVFSLFFHVGLLLS